MKRSVPKPFDRGLFLKTKLERLNNPSTVILVSSWRSSCAWRVRIALNIKEIVYQSRVVDLVRYGGEQTWEVYTRANPMKQVPILMIDDHTMTESMAIMDYLEDTRPLNPLLPEDKFQRAMVRKICEIINSGIQPLHNFMVLNEVQKRKIKKEEWVADWIRRGLQAIEKAVAETKGLYCVGDQVTMADCCLIPEVHKARSYAIDLDDFPTILEIESNLENESAFVDARPEEEFEFMHF